MEAAHAKFAEAVKIVDQDVPSIPVYFYGQQSGHSDKIKKLETDQRRRARPLLGRALIRTV